MVSCGEKKYGEKNMRQDQTEDTTTLKVEALCYPEMSLPTHQLQSAVRQVSDKSTPW